MMHSQDIIKLEHQLSGEMKELIALTDKYVLVKWIQDNSYVSWRYYLNQAGDKYIFEIGHYIRCENTTVEKAIAAFSERINDA